MEQEVVVAVIAAAVIIVGALIFGFSKLLKQFKNDVPRLTQSLLERMPSFIQEAAKYAALFIERLDEEGRLNEIISEYADKADAKLDAATDIAVVKVEEWIAELLLRLGITDVVVDIPEQTIKDYIQKYVWENPDLFPSRAKIALSEESKAQQVAQLKKELKEEIAVEVRHRVPAQAPNYPANLYREEQE